MNALEIHESSAFLFNVRVDNYNYDAAMDHITRFINIKSSKNAHQVCFTNVHSIELAQQNPELMNCINHSDLVLADGSGIKLAGKLFGHPIKENLNGTDFTPLLLEQAEKNGWSVYLLGAKEDVVKLCYKKLKKKYSRVSFLGYRNGYFNSEEEKQIIDEINEKKPDILLIALGSPIQEEWISRNRRVLDTKVCLAVGGLFDFMAGMRKRAPSWLRKLGFEWIYRFFQAPLEKWERIFVEIPVFLFRVIWYWMIESTL